MGNLLLNSLAGRHSHAFRDLKNDRPGRISLLVGKHNVGETVTLHQQATGAQTKKSHGMRNEQTMCTDWPVMWF